MKGYEITYKKPGETTSYVYIQSARCQDDAMFKFHELYGNKHIITKVEFKYKDIRKEFYDIGDKHGWD